MSQESVEHYVSPEEAAEFLRVNRLTIIRMARSGLLPAHPLGAGKRRQWRFKLSELDRKSTRLNLQSRLHLVCRLLLEKKKTNVDHEVSQRYNPALALQTTNVPAH